MPGTWGGGGRGKGGGREEMRGRAGVGGENKEIGNV